MDQHFPSWTYFPFRLFLGVISSDNMSRNVKLYTFGTRMPKTTRRLHNHRTIRTEAARAPYDFRAEAAETVRFPQDLRTPSLRLCPSPSPKARTRNRTLLVYNVNTYAVARSHLQCLKVVRKYPVSILYKSIAGRYRPVRVADGPITARY